MTLVRCAIEHHTSKLTQRRHVHVHCFATITSQRLSLWLANWLRQKERRPHRRHRRLIQRQCALMCQHERAEEFDIRRGGQRRIRTGQQRRFCRPQARLNLCRRPLLLLHRPALHQTTTRLELKLKRTEQRRPINSNLLAMVMTRLCNAAVNIVSAVIIFSIISLQLITAKLPASSVERAFN